jgi:hypothetical protein
MFARHKTLALSYALASRHSGPADAMRLKQTVKACESRKQRTDSCKNWQLI